MKDLFVEMTHGEGKVSVIFVERGKETITKTFKNDADAIDWLIKKFAGEVE